ncbi:MAG: AsmA-like C-terminal region-containing protein [Prevotellaceae bacterium]|nr:AsmA-like C-terminal region-containing protein [Prevotellaceae bacterium]
MLFVISSIVLTFIYRNDIISAALEAVAQNNELYFKSQNVDITISLSLKNTALLFGNVDVRSKKNVSGVSFGLQAETLRAEVDLLRFALHREIKIRKLLMSNGQLNVRLAQSKSGNPKATPKMPDTEALLQGVNRIQLERCLLSLEDVSNRSVEVEIETLSAHVEQKDEGLNLRAKGLLAVQLSKKQKPSKHTRAAISIDAKGNLSQGVATITGSKLNVDGVALEATGSIAFRPLGEVNMDVTGKNLSLESAVKQVRQYVELTAPEQLSGNADVNVRLTGSLKEKATLSFAGSGAVRNAAVKLKDMEAFSAKDLRYTITGYDIKKLQSYACAISSNDVSCGDLRFSGNGEISNFKSPQYSVNANFSGDIAALKMESLREGEVQGTVQVHAKDWSYEGVEAISVQASVSNLKALLQNEVYNLNGQLTADKNTLLTRLDISCAAAEGSFDGTVQGYLLASPGKREAEAKATLKIRGDLAAKRLDMDMLLAQRDSSAFNLNIYANLNAQADEVTVFEHVYKNVSGIVDYKAPNLTINKLKVEAFDGTLGGDVKWRPNPSGSNRLSCDLYFNSVKLESLYYLNENFKIKPGSMQGKCDGAITLVSDVNSEGLDMDNLSATVDFTINQGRLLEFAPIQPLSSYLKKSLLQDVRFSALRNTVNLEKGKITIPKMEVRSTALNVFIAGTQELKGDFDYHITLYLGELLSGKEKNIDNPIKEDKTKLFLHFTSKNGVTEVTHDSREWSKNIGKKASREAQEMRTLLRSGLGANKNVRAATQKKEKITVEWEEDQSVGAAEKAEKAEKVETKPKPKPETKAKKKQRSAVEVEWNE